MNVHTSPIQLDILTHRLLAKVNLSNNERPYKPYSAEYRDSPFVGICQNIQQVLHLCVVLFTVCNTNHTFMVTHNIASVCLASTQKQQQQQQQNTTVLGSHDQVNAEERREKKLQLTHLRPCSSPGCWRSVAGVQCTWTACRVSQGTSAPRLMCAACCWGWTLIPVGYLRAGKGSLT